MGIHNYDNQHRHKGITAIVVILILVISFYLSTQVQWRHENGQAKRTDRGKISTWYYENGRKQMQGRLEKGEREGVWTIWDMEGNKTVEMQYEENKLNGTYTTYDKVGKVLSTRKYINDVPQ